ncbi:ANTAR domain-containing protein, partial [Kitasatospora sp. NPDC059462]
MTTGPRGGTPRDPGPAGPGPADPVPAAPRPAAPGPDAAGPPDGGEPAADDVARQLAGTVRRLQHAAERMRAEEGTRALVDLATGMLAERLAVPPVEAAARLAHLAGEAGVPVVTLAADVVGRSVEPAGRAPAGPPAAAPGASDASAAPGPS